MMANLLFRPLRAALRDDPWQPWIWLVIPFSGVLGFLWVREPIPTGWFLVLFVALLLFACLGGMAWMDDHAGTEVFVTEHISPLSKAGAGYVLGLMLMIPLRPLLDGLLQGLGYSVQGLFMGAFALCFMLASRHVWASLRARH